MRPSNDEYFIGIAEAVSKRATCERRSVGCVLTDKNHRVLSTGYNGVPSKYPHCPSQEDCGGANGKSGDTSKCIARHAEDIAIAKCIDIYQIHTAYVTTKPCAACVRRLLDTSCIRIVFRDDYPDNAGEELWVSNGRKWSKL